MKLAPASSKKLGREYSRPLELKPEQNVHTDRWDLRVDLAKGSGLGGKHLHYHRLVGLACKKTWNSPTGRKLRKPRYVETEAWDPYEVDHSNWNTLDCRLRNLKLPAAYRHRGEGRDAWQKKTLPHGRKVQMIKDILRKQSPPTKKRVAAKKCARRIAMRRKR